MKRMAILVMGILVGLNSFALTFEEFKLMSSDLATKMQNAHDRSAYCGFFAFADAQGLTLMVNSSNQRSASVFIPVGNAVDLSTHADQTQNSSVKTYKLSSGAPTLKVVESYSPAYSFTGVMLYDGKTTVNCAVVSH